MSNMHCSEFHRLSTFLPKSPSGDEISIESIATAYPRETTSSENEMRLILATRETKAIRYLKCFVISILVLAAIAMSYATFLLISKSEYDLFVSSFRNDANRLKLAYYKVTTQRISVSTSFIMGYLTQAELDRQSLVDIKLFDFNIFGHNMLHLGNAESIAFAPIVKREEQSQWENTYRINHLWQVFSDNKAHFNYSGIVSRRIWHIPNSPFSNEDQMAPISQVTPLELRRGMLFLDCYSDRVRGQAIDVLMNDSRPVSSGILYNETEAIFVINYSYTPRSVIMVPVITATGKNDIVGITMLEHRWDTGFRGVIQGDSPVHAVVENSCEDQFTLKISGSEVIYFGEGDHHNFRYDSLVVTTNELELLSYWNHIQSDLIESQYIYAKLRSAWIVREPLKNECRYTIHFYPTDEYYHSHATKRPIVYAIFVALIFLFTILLFLTYDYLVEKRQSVMMNTAVTSSDIVNQLYPPSFVCRFTQTSIHGSRNNFVVRSTCRQKVARRKSTQGHKELLSLKDFLMHGTLPDSNISSSNIFAEMFNDVTVILADISGFTAWSSEREPSQVFQLLETLYSAFDEVAKGLGVFKVETIGDCYVAVVGLPAPRPAHAVVMCRFAHEVHRRTSVLTKELDVQLGSGTSDLQMRIGIHSGPVTAGVLRGEKSRFQLFGDTMNTAARMESTGERGKTQVSEDTAKLLIGFGKHHWLIPREERVYAKGKGELQTYWINTTQRKNHTSSCQVNKISHFDGLMQSQHNATSKGKDDKTCKSLESSFIHDAEAKERMC